MQSVQRARSTAIARSIWRRHVEVGDEAQPVQTGAQHARSLRSGTATAAAARSGGRSTNTMLVCGDLHLTPGSPCRPSASGGRSHGRRPGGRCGGPARASPPRPARRPGASPPPASCARVSHGRSGPRSPHQGRAGRRAQALAEAHRDAVEQFGHGSAAMARAGAPPATAALNRRAPSRWVARPRRRASAVASACRPGHHPAAPGVLQRQQPRHARSARRRA
jgi:hypothetical protein